MYYVLSFYFLCHFVFLLLSRDLKTVNKKTELTPTQPTYSVTTNEQAFAKKLYHSLQTADVKEWLTLFPTNAEYRLLMEKMASIKLDGLTHEKAEAMIKQRQSEAAIRYTKDFKMLQQQAKEAGLHWKQSVYSNFIFDVNKTAIGTHYLNGDIWLNIGKTEFVIEGVEAIETPGGYRLQNVADVRKLDNEE